MSERAARRRAMREIKKLTDQIPAFDCIPGCTACCGPVPWSAPEFNSLPAGIEPPYVIQVVDNTVTPVASSACLDCPFSLDGNCQVYEDRPFMCRLYGTVENLPCAYGKRPKRMLTSAQGQSLLERYHRLLEQYPAELPAGIQKVRILPPDGDIHGPSVGYVVGVTK